MDTSQFLEKIKKMGFKLTLEEAVNERKTSELVAALTECLEYDAVFESFVLALDDLSGSLGELTSWTIESLAADIIVKIESTNVSVVSIRLSLLLKEILQAIDLAKFATVRQFALEKIAPLLKRSESLNKEKDELLQIAILFDALAAALILDSKYAKNSFQNEDLNQWLSDNLPNKIKTAGEALILLNAILIKSVKTAQNTGGMGELLSSFLSKKKGIKRILSTKTEQDILQPYDLNFYFWQTLLARFDTFASFCNSEQLDRLAALFYSNAATCLSLPTSDPYRTMAVSFLSSHYLWEVQPIRRHLVTNFLKTLNGTVKDNFADHGEVPVDKESDDWKTFGIWLEKLWELVGDQAPVIDGSSRKPNLIWAKLMAKFLDLKENCGAQQPNSFAHVLHFLEIVQNCPIEFLNFNLKSVIFGAMIVVSSFARNNINLLEISLNIMDRIMENNSAEARSCLAKLHDKVDCWLKEIVFKARRLPISHSQPLLNLVHQILAASDSLQSLVDHLQAVFQPIENLENNKDKLLFAVCMTSLQAQKDLRLGNNEEEEAARVLCIDRVIRVINSKLTEQRLSKTSNFEDMDGEQLQNLTAVFEPIAFISKSRQFSDTKSTDKKLTSELNEKLPLLCELAQKVVMREVLWKDVGLVVDSFNFLLATHHLGHEPRVLKLPLMLQLYRYPGEPFGACAIADSSVKNVKTYVKRIFAQDSQFFQNTDLGILLAMLKDIAHAKNQQKTAKIVDNLGKICTFLAENVQKISSDGRESRILALELCTSLLGLAKKLQGGQIIQFLGFSLTLASISCPIAKRVEAETECDFELLKAIYDVLNTSLINYSNLITNQMAAPFSALTKNFLMSVIYLCSERSKVKTEEKMALCRLASRLCALMASFKVHFAKTVPFIIGDYCSHCVEVVLDARVKWQLSQAMRRLLSLCDSHSIAMLSASLPNRGPKQIFAQLCKDQKKLNVFAV